MGLYEFCRLPFGLSGSPSTFQLLRDQPFLMVYIDDILIFSDHTENHTDHLHKVFHRLRKHRITLHAENGKLGFTEVAYLGHIFGKEGMSPDPAKVQVIKDWLTPTDINGLRRILGLASYYRRYIKGFSTIAEPLLRLTNKDMAYTSACQNAFDCLKQHLQSQSG